MVPATVTSPFPVSADFIDHPDMNTEQVPPLQIPYAVQVPLRLVQGAIGGFAMYGIQRALVWSKFVEYNQPVTYLPYVLSGLASAAMIETAKLTYLLALKLIGERSVYENLDINDTAVVSKLRSYSWSVVRFAENVEKKVDSVFSKVVGIRTAQEITSQQVQDKDLFFLEIFRRSLGDQLSETASTALPQQLGIEVVTKLGYTVLGFELMLGLQVLQFVSGLLDKITQVYHRIREEEERLENSLQTPPVENTTPPVEDVKQTV